VIFPFTSPSLICLMMNLVPLSSARKRISLLSTVNNLSTTGENCGYRHFPSQQTPPGTPLRGEKVIQGQVLPFLIKILSDFTVFSDQGPQDRIPNRDTISTGMHPCMYVYAHLLGIYAQPCHQQDLVTQSCGSFACIGLPDSATPTNIEKLYFFTCSVKVSPSLNFSSHHRWT